MSPIAFLTFLFSVSNALLNPDLCNNDYMNPYMFFDVSDDTSLYCSDESAMCVVVVIEEMKFSPQQKENYLCWNNTAFLWTVSDIKLNPQGPKWKTIFNCSVDYPCRDLISNCAYENCKQACPNDCKGKEDTTDGPEPTIPDLDGDTSTCSTDMSSSYTELSTYTEDTITPTTIKSFSCNQSSCLNQECYFNGSCYFVVYDIRSKGYFKTYYTSGVKSNQTVHWINWSGSDNTTAFNNLAYVAIIFIPTLGLNWNFKEISNMGSKIAVLCKRPQNSFISSTLEQQCIERYRNECNSIQYCCSVDGENNLWFMCSTSQPQLAKEPCLLSDTPSEASKPITFRTWDCTGGNFATDSPDTRDCRCSSMCSQEFNDKIYTACPHHYAFQVCPLKTQLGLSRWYCLEDGTFLGSTPDLSECCDDMKFCLSTDQYLTTWRACLGQNVTKVVNCPNDKYGFATWHCDQYGKFDKPGPLFYCDSCLKCKQMDQFGVTWEACVGEAAVSNCTSGQTGSASWNCSLENGTPTFMPRDYADYSKCVIKWIDDIQNLIHNNSLLAEEIMDKIVEHLDNETSEHVIEKELDVINSCVDLYLKQNQKNATLESFESFTESFYASLLLITEAQDWENMQSVDIDENRNYLIKITEKLGFALTEVSPELFDSYNKTFGNTTSLLLNYNRQLNQLAFSGENYTIAVEDEEISKGNMYAAVGILFSADVVSPLFPLSNSTNSTRRSINTPVVSLSVKSVVNETTNKLENVTVKMTLRHIKRAREPKRRTIYRRLYPEEDPSPVLYSAHCFYYSNSDWSGDGCEILLTNSTETTCHCKHLSSISVLFDIHEYKPDPTLETMSLTCSLFTIISLLLATIIFVSFGSLKGDRNFIAINLCSCLLISHLMMLTVIDRKFFYFTDDVCTIVAIALEYVLLASFFWMSIEAYYLYQMIVIVFIKISMFRLKSCILAYGFPLIIISFTGAISLLWNERAFGRDEICWLALPNFVWSFIGPVILLCSVNLIILIIAMRLAVRRRRKNEKIPVNKYLAWLRGGISLATLLGVTWLLGLAYIGESPVFVYIFVLINGLQGIFIFFFRCVLNEQVRGTFRNQWHVLSSRYFRYSDAKTFPSTVDSENSERPSTSQNPEEHQSVSKTDSENCSHRDKSPMPPYQEVLRSIQRTRMRLSRTSAFADKPKISDDVLKNNGLFETTSSKK